VSGLGTRTVSGGSRKLTFGWLVAVITAEPSNNVNLCGFGSGGRLGESVASFLFFIFFLTFFSSPFRSFSFIYISLPARSVHSLPSLTPIPDFPHTIVSLALGQDHTLALTNHGHVLSWGTNRFSVLGYQLDVAPSSITTAAKFSMAGGGGGMEEAVQPTPRRIVGSLKKEEVLGVAASRCSSACWTSEAVWTWGYNNGHLGEYNTVLSREKRGNLKLIPFSTRLSLSSIQATTSLPTPFKPSLGKSQLSLNPS